MRIVKDKNERQKLIKELIEQENVKTQEELVNQLRENGYNVTQATVSRDVNEMGLVRDETGYKSAEEKTLEDVFRWVNDIKRTGNNLIIILTDSGTAQTVALAVDKAKIDGIIGSVAGDDTIFLAVDEGKSDKVMELLEGLNERTLK